MTGLCAPPATTAGLGARDGAQLEHVIRAAATIARDTEIVVIGSQAILGQYPDAPAELCVSADADVYPRHHPERADLIDGSIGELPAGTQDDSNEIPARDRDWS